MAELPKDMIYHFYSDDDITIKLEAMELVRCKDCVHYEIVQLKRDGTDDMRYKPSYCTWLGFYPKPDGFCADGERREDGTADK